MFPFLNYFFPKRYESRAMLDYYIRAQYGPYLTNGPTHAFEDFYQQVLAVARTYIDAGTSALDVGCGVGRLPFEYARLGALTACGTETSDTFLHFSQQLAQHAVPEVSYPIPETLPTFLKDDICVSKLPSASFNFVSCLNVIDRVPNPRAAIASIERLLLPGGIALIADPYDWECSPTPKRARVADIKELLSEDMWTIENEQNLLYRVPTGKNSYRNYDCHLVIARRRFG